MESLNVHLKIHNRLMAHITHWIVLEVNRILVPLHIPFARKHFIAQVTGELSPLALVYLTDMHP